MSTQPSDDPIGLSQVISGMANNLEDKKKKLKLLEQALEARRHRRHKKEQQKKWTIGGLSVLGTLGLGAIGLKFNFWGKRNSAFEAPSSEPQTYIKAAVLEKIKGAINWRENNVGSVQITERVPLGKLQEYQALGGIRAISSGTAEGVNISQNTLNELKNLAKAAGIANPEKQNEMIAQYIRGYDQYMANHTDPTSEIKTKALAASLGEVQKYIENNTGTMSWLRDARDTVVARLTNTAEWVVGRIPMSPSVAAERSPAMPSSTAPTHGSPSSGVLGQGFGMVSATMATVQLVSTWQNIGNKERLLLAAQATAGALAAAGKANPALTSALFVANTVRASTANAYETRTTTLATKQEALQSTLATQAGTLGGKVKKYAAVAWNAFQVTGATVSVVQSVAANGVRDFARQEQDRVVLPMVVEQAGQARDAVVHQTSQMLTQAQEVTGNAVASTRENLGKLQERFANLFNRQTTAAL